MWRKRRTCQSRIILLLLILVANWALTSCAASGSNPQQQQQQQRPTSTRTKASTNDSSSKTVTLEPVELIRRRQRQQQQEGRRQLLHQQLPTNPVALYLNQDAGLLSSRQIPLKSSSSSTSTSNKQRRHRQQRRLTSLLVDSTTTATTTTTKRHQHIRRRRQKQKDSKEESEEEEEQEELLVSSSTATTTTTATSAQNLKAYYYFIQALGKSDNSGSCKHPQPAFTATCPTGAFIVSQSAKSEWRSRLDCSQTNPTTIHCIPKQITTENQHEIDFNDQNGVTIACYGTYNTNDVNSSDLDGGDDQKEDSSASSSSFDPWVNLHVSVEVEAGSYYCDKALEVRVMPHPTVVTGGSVYQTVAIQKQCYTNEMEQSWVFVEPTCGSRRSNTSTNSLSTQQQQQQPQEQQQGSSSVYNTRGGSGPIPDGFSNPFLQTTDIPVTIEGQQEDSDGTSSRDTGTTTTTTLTTTTTSTMSSSSSSNPESISITTIAHCEMENGCQAEYSCPGGCSGNDSCNVDLPGFITTSTSTFTIPGVLNSDCMPRDFIMDLLEGESCEFNLMCSSGVCIDGVCAGQPLVDYEACEEHTDCSSQACGKHPLNSTTVETTGGIEPTDIPQTTCCPSGSTFGHLGESYCTSSQPVGAACHEDAMCSSNICVFDTCREALLEDNVECEEDTDCLGGVCGQYHDPDVKICCPTGASIHLSDGPWCSNRLAGDGCENNANSICKSNICVEGKCQGIEQDAGAVCDNHFDCKNSACALESSDPTSHSICCPSGDYLFVSIENVVSRLGDDGGGGDEGVEEAEIGTDSIRVCTGQPEGVYCGGNEQDLDDLCHSGLCIGGTCKSARLAAGTDCFQDDDCENNVCAWPSLEEEDGVESKICCPSNQHKSVYLPSKSVDGELVDVCTGQPSGARCGDETLRYHALCKSGTCTDAFCEGPTDEP